MTPNIPNVNQLDNTSLPLVSVIILNWNKKQILENCLQSVFNTDYSKLEVIVLDNGSTDGSVSLIKQKFSNVVLIENKSNLGYCEGNNMAVKRAKGDIIILLNNDTLVDKNWVKEIVAVSNDPHVGIIGCKLLFVGTSIIQSLGYSSTVIGYFKNLRLLELDNKKEVIPIKEVDYVSGAALAIKRSLIQKIGLFDPMFFAYFEDVDLCYRVKKNGYNVVVAPEAIVQHIGSCSWSTYAFKRIYANEKNRLLFIIKHYKGLELLKALTIDDLKGSLRLIEEKKTLGGLVGEVLQRKTKSFDRQVLPAFFGRLCVLMDWVCAKFLAYCSISSLLYKSKHEKQDIFVFDIK